MSIQDRADEAIDQYVMERLTSRQRIAIRMCLSDLYNGPLYNADGTLRWETLIPIVQGAADDMLRELWFDTKCEEILEREPEGYWMSECDDTIDPESDEDEWINPEWSDYIKYDYNQIARVVLGELYEYV